MTHVTCRLTAKNRDQLWNPTLGYLYVYLYVCRCEANYILMINTMLLALCMFVIPFCQVLPALAFVLAVMGFNMGSVDTLANLQMISVFGDDVPPFLQVRPATHSSVFTGGRGLAVT